VTLLLAAGALSMIAQVVVLRELVAALYGVELLYVLALGSWLVGTALGSAAGRRLPETAVIGMAGCVALGVLVPAEVALIRTAGPSAGSVPGAFLPFPLQLAWIAAATIPPAAICGLLFPPLAGLAGGRGLSVGRSYAAESAGSAAAGAAVTVAMGFGASTFQVAILAPALGLAAALLAAGRWPRRRRFAAACAVVLAATLAAAQAKPWDLTLLRGMYPALVDAVDTPYARVAISRAGSQVAVFENGAFAFDTEGTSAEAFADLAAVQVAQPRRALVIGGGGEGVPRELARHGIPVIHDLEIDERALDLVRAHTGAAGARPPAGVRVTVVFEEPRRFLDRADSYDLILVAAGEPTSGASSRFYTREFFEQCARRLAPQGVVAVRLAAAENVWPMPLARRTASIVAALRQEFSSLELVAGATLYLFASDSPLAVDPDVLAGRLGERGVHPRLITPPYLRYLYTNDRREEVAQLLRSTVVGGPNRDVAPVCYQYAAMMWLSKFYPDLAAASGRTGRVPGWAWWFALAAAIATVLAWVRGSRNRRMAACLASVGFIGMVLETLLLLRYQIRNGVVYQQVGWLLTCFMAGMTTGGYIAGGPGRGIAPVSSVRALTGPVATFGAALAAWIAIAWIPATAGLAGTSALLIAAGAAVGVTFAAAAALWQDRPGSAASALYSADVAGGAAGAVAATLLLVPTAGLDWTAFIMAAGAAALLLVIPRSGSHGP
jgi:spermidine synthase